MGEVLPKGVTSYRDRHGKERFRYRRAGRSVSLTGRPGEARFNESLAGVEVALIARKEVVDRRVSIVRAHMIDYYARRSIPRARHRSVQKRVPFDITVSDVERMMIRQNYRCAVSGIEFPIHKVDHAETKAFRPSIDRIKPQLGYVVGNVRLVCEIVNLAMNQWGEAALVKLVGEMANHLAHQMANPPTEPYKPL